jgi:hypothetical protein
LTAYLEDFDGCRNPVGSDSDHVMKELGVAGHYQFYPASPIQPPFLVLLRSNENEALRLIRSLCNHSISIWRKVHEHRRRRSQPATPIPITLTFPWGDQTFRGDGQIYLWFSGLWGNGAVQSALMALEQWALERIEGGANFDDIFQKSCRG